MTGGAGFIGSNLVDRLIQEGHQVVVVDNLSTGKYENINSRANFYQMDIQDEGIEKIFRDEKIELVNHHAAQMDVRRSVEDPIFDAKVNLIGLLNLLQNCVKYRVKKFIFASSGGVIYGESRILPAKEEFSIAPLSPYGITKATSEDYLLYYKETYGLKYTALRYANVYGERQAGGEAGVIAIFIKKMLQNERPIIYGDGEQVRDYVYVKDVVEANIKAMEKGDNSSFNIGTGISVSVNRLFTMLKERLNFEKEPVYGDERAGEIRRNYLDYNKAERELNWSPTVKLEDGLVKTIEYFRGETGGLEREGTK